MSLVQWLDLAAATFLTTSIGVFVLRYGLRAPWYRSFEGRVIFLTFSAFFFTMLNLVVFLITGWSGYRWGMFVTMTVAGVLVVYQNVMLTRARRNIRAGKA